jgi:uncharacterized protein (TIGR02996 family)
MARAKAKPKPKTSPAPRRAKAKSSTARPAKSSVRAKTVVPLATQLATARDAVARGDLGGGLTMLLDAWRARPAAAIADAIDAIGEKAAAGLAPPSGKTTKDKNAAWATAARQGDAAVRGVLVATLTDTKGNAETLERLELLVPHRDPRVAKKVADLLETPIYNTSVHRTRKFWKRLLELTTLLGDERMLARSAAFAAAWKDNRSLNITERGQLNVWLRKLAPPLAESFGEPHPLTPDEAALCRAVVAAVPAPTAQSLASRRTADELLAAIYADPADDAARMVYADLLSTRGDPRGELITLQLARARGEKQTREQARREKDLLAEHMMDWLGPIGPMIKKTTAVFERGFLDTADLKDGAVDASPVWSTVRSLGGGVPPPELAMPMLHVLRDLHARLLIVLGERPTPLAVEELHWCGPDFWRSEHYPEHDERETAAVAAFNRLALPLRRLDLDGGYHWNRPPLSELSFAWTAPCTARLETLGLSISLAMLREVLEAVRPTTIRRLIFRDHQLAAEHLSLAFEREPGGDFTHLTFTSPDPYHAEQATLDALVEGVDALPADQLQTILIDAPENLAETIEATFRRQKRAQITVK